MLFSFSWYIKGWVLFLGSLFKSNNRLIGLVVRVFANDPGDLGSMTGRVIPKTLKMVLDTYLLNTQQYEDMYRGESDTIQEKELCPSLHLGIAAIEKGAFLSPSTAVANFNYFFNLSQG